MRKLLTIILFTACTIAFADCPATISTDERIICLDKSLGLMQKQLNISYKKAYNRTSAKNKLKISQQKWHKYVNDQCGNMVNAVASPMSATVLDLQCQTELTKKRIIYLNKL